MKKKKTIVLILIVYLLFALYVKTNSFEPKIKDTEDSYIKITKNLSIIQTIAYKLLQPIIKSRIDYYIEINGLTDHIKKINTKFQEENIFHTYDISYGNEKKTVCGDEISAILYQVKSPQSFNLLDVQSLLGYNNETISFKIGEHLVKELNYGIEGMHEKGERIIIIPNNHSKNQHVSYYIKLLNIKSNVIGNVEELLIFDNPHENFSSKIRCGDTVSIKYTFREHDGSILLKDQLITFKVGKRKAPLPLELGVLNMRRKSSRSIIIPVKLLNNMHSDISYDRKTIKIIDIETIE